MRILHIMQCANLGGMEQTTLLRMIGLKSRGNQVRLVSLNPLGQLEPLLKQNGIPAVGLPYRGRRGWRSLGLMYRAFRAEPVDAIMMHGHNLAAMLALGNLCRERRVLCLHFHHTGVKPEWQWRMVYRVALKQFPVVTYPTDFIRREAQAMWPPLAAISCTLRNPFPLPELASKEERAEARRSLGLPPDAPVVGNAGWLIERKRFDIFLRVAAAIARQAPDALFLIAGDGPLRASLVRMAAELGIADRVRWVGWQRDLTAFYSSLDVLHFNSHWDALGRTPLEALTYGVPVVASVVHGGLSEILDGQGYAYLTATHDVEWLKEKIVFLLSNPEVGRRMVTAARARLSGMCSPEKDLETICQLLRL
jgi:glycosyltransferase involved in cell wall biosynthesis